MISVKYRNKNTGAEFFVSSVGEPQKISKIKEIETLSGCIEITISDNKDIQNSSSLFKRFGYLLAEIFDPIFDSFSERFDAQVHTFRNIQAQMKQKVESILGNDMLLAHKSHAQKTFYALERVKEDPDLATDTILFLQKRIFELEAHMSSFELIHAGKKIQLEKKYHNFPKVIHNVYSAFEDNFEKIGVSFNFAFSPEIGENLDVLFDYKTINTALYNIFDNAYKYIKPYTEIRFFIADRKVIISMRSLKIDKDEQDKIFKLNYRGKNALDHTKGSGVGMYVVEKALELNDMSIEFQPDYSDCEIYEGKQFVMNKFIINF
jgi:signal transduction histidine kinase